MAAARGARRRGVRVEKCILGGWKQKEDGRIVVILERYVEAFYM
jgi:hypothetical protein